MYFGPEFKTSIFNPLNSLILLCNIKISSSFIPLSLQDKSWIIRYLGPTSAISWKHSKSCFPNILSGAWHKIHSAPASLAKIDKATLSFCSLALQLTIVGILFWLRFTDSFIMSVFSLKDKLEFSPATAPTNIPAHPLEIV